AAPGVAGVELVTKDDALARFERIAGSAELLAGLAENPLPPSLEIRLAPEARTEEALAVLTAELADARGIDELAHGQEWIEGYARAIALVRGLALGLGVVLALAALLIVANTIRLAIYARRDELDILALVGASRTFVRVPYLLEGVIQGTLGGALGIALLYGLFRIAVPQLGDALELFLGWSQPRFLSAQGIATLVAGGAAFGLIGAAVAVARTRVS